MPENFFPPMPTFFVERLSNFPFSCVFLWDSRGFYVLFCLFAAVRDTSHCMWQIMRTWRTKRAHIRAVHEGQDFVFFFCKGPPSGPTKGQTETQTWSKIRNRIDSIFLVNFFSRMWDTRVFFLNCLKDRPGAQARDCGVRSCTHVRGCAPLMSCAQPRNAMCASFWDWASNTSGLVEYVFFWRWKLNGPQRMWENHIFGFLGQLGAKDSPFYLWSGPGKMSPVSVLADLS